MVTITYNWSPPQASDVIDTLTSGNQIQPAIGSNAAGDSYFAAWTTIGPEVDGRIMHNPVWAVTPEFRVNTTTVNSQNDPSVAGLKNGGYVVTYTDYSTNPKGDLHAKMFNADGS